MPNTPADPPSGDLTPTDPLDRVTLDASLTKLLTVVLESLTPAKRVAFVLHDVFGVPYDAISEIVGRSPSATRKLTRSVRRRIHYRPSDGPDPAQTGVMHEFFLACSAGDVTRLERLLDPEVTVQTDHGGTARSIDNVRGAPAAAALLIELLADEQKLSEQSVNGGVGLVLRQSGHVVGIVLVNTRNDLVLDVWIVTNPDKLRNWNTL
ncbi:MAG: sigma factor-like helix-turn-helix DNA-binding protein [Nakamurella sp.]